METNLDKDLINLKQIVDLAIEKSYQENLAKNIYQESDWKCYLYHLILEGINKYNLNEIYAIHTELQINSYEKSGRCDLCIIDKKKYFGHDFNRLKHKIVPEIAIELKVHGGNSKKGNSTKFSEKLNHFQSDYQRLYKTKAKFAYCLFFDFETHNSNINQEREKSINSICNQNNIYVKYLSDKQRFKNKDEVKII